MLLHLPHLKREEPAMAGELLTPSSGGTPAWVCCGPDPALRSAATRSPTQIGARSAGGCWESAPLTAQSCSRGSGWWYRRTPGAGQDPRLLMGRCAGQPLTFLCSEHPQLPGGLCTGAAVTQHPHPTPRQQATPDDTFGWAKSHSCCHQCKWGTAGSRNPTTSLHGVSIFLKGLAPTFTRLCEALGFPSKKENSYKLNPPHKEKFEHANVRNLTSRRRKRKGGRCLAWQCRTQGLVIFFPAHRLW